MRVPLSSHNRTRQESFDGLRVGGGTQPGPQLARVAGPVSFSSPILPPPPV